MISLALAALYFLGLHFIVAGTSLRLRLIKRLGERLYHAIFSLLSLSGFIWMLEAYRSAEFIETWGLIPALKPVAAVLMFFSIQFAVSGLCMRQVYVATGVQRICRHPVLMGMAIWAFAHVLVNGDVASLIFFGSLLGLVLGGMATISGNRHQSDADRWARFVAETSIVPFYAILKGRNRLKRDEFGVSRFFLGSAAFGLAFYLHSIVLGVSPF